MGGLRVAQVSSFILVDVLGALYAWLGFDFGVVISGFL